MTAKKALILSLALLATTVVNAEPTSIVPTEGESTTSQSVNLPSTAVISKSITAQELVTLQSVSQVKVSPSGEFIAYTRSVPREVYIDEDGKNWHELYLVDNKGEERAYITGKVNVQNIQWSAKGSAIYFLAKMHDDKFTALYKIPTYGGQAQKVIALKKSHIRHYALSSDNTKVALLAKAAKEKSIKKLKKLGFKAEVFEENLENQLLYVTDLIQTKKALAPEPWPIKGNVSDVSFSPSNNDLLIKTQPSALVDDSYMKSKWHLVDIASKAIRHTFSTQGKIAEAEFSYDGKHVALITAADQHDPKPGRLFIADTTNGKMINALANFQGHVTEFEWANKKNELYFIADINAQSIIAKLKPQAKQYDLLVAAGTFIPAELSLSNSDKTITIKAHTAEHPNEVFVLRGKKQVRLTQSNTWLNDKQFAEQKNISIKARDGVEIGGVLIYPLNYEKGQRYPLIMSVHGGPESHVSDGWVTSYSRPGQVAAAQGYAIFYPNYRGSTGKGVEYSKLGQNDYAGKEFDDLVDLKNHLVNIGLVNDKKVGITGGSYGGYAAAWGATKLTEHFAASVMFVGISNQISKFGTTNIPNEMHMVHARSYPWDKWQWYLERSPIYWAEQSNTPLLIMHGKDDPRVHPAQSMEMYRYMKVHGKAVRLVYYPDEGHGNRNAAAKYDYNLRLMRWMDNYLKHDDKPMPPHELSHKDNLTNKED